MNRRQRLSVVRERRFTSSAAPSAPVDRFADLIAVTGADRIIGAYLADRGVTLDASSKVATWADALGVGPTLAGPGPSGNAARPVVTGGVLDFDGADDNLGLITISPLGTLSAVRGANPGLALDGDTTTRWATGSFLDLAVDRFTVDMGAVHSVSGLTIDNSSFQNDIPLSGDIQISTDGSTFTTTASWTSANISAGILSKPFTAVSTRYIKLVPTSLCAVGSNWWSIGSIDITGWRPGFSVIALVKSTETGATGRAIIERPSSVPALWFDTTGKIQLDSGALTGASVRRNAWTFAASAGITPGWVRPAGYDGKTLIGTSTASVATIGPGTIDLSVLWRSAGSNWFKGQVFGLLLYRCPLSGSDVGAIYDKLNAYFQAAGFAGIAN